MAGLILLRQTAALGRVIDDLVLVAEASTAEEHNQIAPGAGSIPSVSPTPRSARSPLYSSEV